MLALPLRGSTPELYHGKYVAGMFGSGEQGVWYDPSDLSTMYQDAYGTTPVTAVGQPVGLILDKSKRVIFKITKADLLDNAKWTGYNSVSGNRPTAVQLADGTVRITRNSTDTYVAFAPMANAYSLPPGCVVHFKYSVRSNTNNLTKFSGEPYYNWRNVNPYCFEYIPSASVLTKNTVAINYTAAPITTSSSGWAPTLFGFYMAGADHAADEYIDVFDFEITAYAPAARQLTTASRPTLQQDSSGKYYLSFDGVDDYLSTGSIDFTGTDKMTVLAGVRKLRDSPIGTVVEASTNSETNDGAFFMTAPPGGGNTFLFGSRGTQLFYAYTPVGGVWAAPISVVQSGISEIASKVIMRLNGALAAQQLASQGSGNYGNYPLYIGRRGGTTNPFSGNLYGLIVRGAQTDDLHLTHAEKFLAYKSGVTL